MKMSEVEKLLMQSTGDSHLEIKIPSTGEIINLKSMTVGHRKSMIKYASNGNEQEQILNFQIAKLGLIKALSLSEFNENILTEVDFIYILAHIRMNNILDDLVLDNIKCPKCKTIFKHNVNFIEICKKCEQYKFIKEEVIIKDKAGNEWKFQLADPTIYDIITLEKYFLASSAKYIIKQLSWPFLYIKSIKLNNNLIEDFAQEDILKRIEFFDSLPESVPVFEKNGLIKLISDRFDINNIKEIYGKIQCPKCNHNIEGVITSDSFFTL